MSIYAKIAAVMGDIQYLRQDDSIRAGAESYRAITEEKVTSTVRAAMLKHGLVLYPVSMTRGMDRYEVVRSSGKTGIDYVTTVDALYAMVDTETGESITIASSGTGIDTGDKAVGKAMTYAYKYALLRTFAIPTGEDPDKIASEDVAPPQRAATKPAPAPAGPVPRPVVIDPAARLTTAQRDYIVSYTVVNGTQDPARTAELKRINSARGYNRTSDVLQRDFDEIANLMEELAHE